MKGRIRVCRFRNSIYANRNSVYVCAWSWISVSNSIKRVGKLVGRWSSNRKKKWFFKNKIRGFLDNDKIEKKELLSFTLWNEVFGANKVRSAGKNIIFLISSEPGRRWSGNSTELSLKIKPYIFSWSRGFPSNSKQVSGRMKNELQLNTEGTRERTSSQVSSAIHITIVGVCLTQAEKLIVSYAARVLVWLGFYDVSTIVGYSMPNPLHTYIKYIWFVFFGFYGISTIVGYSMPNPLHTYIKYIWFVLFGFYGISTIVGYSMPNRLHTYIKYIGFVLFGFYGISTIVGYSMPNPLHTYIKYIGFGLFGFYGISTIVGFSMPNPFYSYMICKGIVCW